MRRTAQMGADGRMNERDGDLAMLAEASRHYAGPPSHSTAEGQTQAV